MQKEIKVKFSVDELSAYLKTQLTDVEFALILGSAQDGILYQDSDLDIALYLKQELGFSLLASINESIISFFDPSYPKVDIGILNNAEPIYCFEALKGKLLFCRNDEKYLDFFVSTCKAYEMQMRSYQRQQNYRLEYCYA